MVMDSEYEPFKSYLPPQSGTNLDVPISPNGAFYNLFIETNPRLSAEKQKEMEYYRLMDFHNKKAQGKDKVWYQTRIDKLCAVKPRKFQHSTYFEFEIERGDTPMRVTTADFPDMNPEDILYIALKLKHKIETQSKYKPAFAAVRKYIENHARDFIQIDGELCSQLLHTEAPPPDLVDERVKDLRTGTTLSPEAGIIFWEDNERTSKQFIKLSQFHRYSNRFLKGIKNANDKSKHADEEVKAGIRYKIEWIFLVRKWLKFAWNFVHDV